MNQDTTGGTLSRMSAWCAVVGVSLLFILVPLAWWPKDLYGLIKWVLVGIVAIVAAGAWLATSLAEGSISIRRNLVNLPLALFISWSILSLWMGPSRYYVLRRLSEVSFLALLYVALLPALRERSARMTLIVAALVGLSTISVFGITHYFGCLPLESPWGAGLGRRTYATMLNPNFLADFIISLFPMAFSCFIFTARGRAVRNLLVVVMLLSTVCLVFTVSWGGLLGWLVSIILCVSFARTRCRRYAMVARVALIVAVLLGIVAAFLYVNRDTVTSDYSGMKYRMLYWRASLAMIRERPILGFGVNSFQPYIPKYLTEIIASDFKDGFPADGKTVAVYDGLFAHDEYLAVWMELGIVGLVFFIWLFYRFFAQGAKNISLNGGALESAIAVGAMGGMAAMLAQSIVSYPFRVPASTTSTALLLAFVGSGAGTRVCSIDLSAIPRVLRWLGALLLAAACVMLVPRVTHQLAGERLYVEARYASFVGNWPVVRQRCHAALEYSITEPEIYDLLGEAEEHLGLYEDAVRTYLSGIELEPYDVHKLMRLGIVYDKLGQEDMAVRYLRAAYALERHDSAEARIRLAEILDRKGEGDEAVALLMDGLRRHRTDWNLRNALGIAYASKGDLTGAMREFLAAQERDENPVPRYNMYVLKRYGTPRGGRSQEMFMGLSQYVWVRERLNKGRSYLKRGKREAAREEFQGVLDRYPDYAPALSNMGTYHRYARQIEKATEFWNRARGIDPKQKPETSL
jgi:O-antigen ligase/tetratricopeptide (TPR) repeat protein